MNTKNILRYLRIKGEPDALTAALIRDCAAEAKKAVSPTRIYRVCQVSPAPDGVFLDSELFSGDGIRKRLSGCDHCALFAVTLGAKADLLVRKYAATQPSRAAVMQAVLAEMTEDQCELLQKELLAAFPQFAASKRFSPGYPGLPIAFQKQFFAMLDLTKRTGVTLTDADMMIPTKTVTAFLGLRLLNAEAGQAVRKDDGAYE